MTNGFTELFVSLGHNASAVLACDGKVVRGYEQERLDRKKSSSAYPKEAIDLALDHDISCDRISVSHWFDHYDLGSIDTKYLDYGHLSSISSTIVSLHEWMTHHDAHARSAVGFARMQGVTGPMRVVVIDGFGNRQECFSAYDVGDDMTLKKIHRTYGYMLSLGLMYQYTTEYLGLKPNQDEYKLLGYEAHVTEFITHAQAEDVARIVAEQARLHATMMRRDTHLKPLSDDLIDYEALKVAKDHWMSVADCWRRLTRGSQAPDLNAVRACVAFCAQTFLEVCVTELMSLLPAPVNDATIVMAGGSFYNVKLNRRVQTFTGRRCFTHPLAGDQGAAMGLAENTCLLSDLTVGQRRFGSVAAGGVLVVSQAKWQEVVADTLDSGRVVNVVRGAMEFGPRALCNTTTFAMPTLSNVALINALNERDEAMPMAPVMTRDAALRLLVRSEIESIKYNDRFMITTCAFVEQPADDMLGVAHRDPLEDVWTARPQVTDDIELLKLLAMTPQGVLINTSFNYHGEPIVFSFDDAMRTHSMQVFRAKTKGLKEPVTIVVKS